MRSIKCIKLPTSPIEITLLWEKIGNKVEFECNRAITKQEALFAQEKAGFNSHAFEMFFGQDQQKKWFCYKD
jgi:hypothetical protein